MALAATGASGQASMLEHWTADYIRLGWMPTWMAPDAEALFPMDDDYRLAVSSDFNLLSFGTGGAMNHGRSSARLRRPLGGSPHILRLGVTQEVRGVSIDANEPFLRTAFGPTIDVGIESRYSLGRFGEVGLTSVGAWEQGVSWSIGLQSSSSVHDVKITRWRSDARRLTLALPTDSVTDVAMENGIDGMLVEANASILLGTVRPSVSLSFETHDLQPESIDRETFLTFSPTGSLERLDLRIAIGVGEAGVGVRHRRQESDLTGPFHRTSSQAGKLFFGRSRLNRWALELWRLTAGNRWSLQFGVDDSDTELSARLETWSFVALWEQLGATAFRYRGSVTGDVQWVRLENTAAGENRGGFSWAANAGMYHLAASQEDWLVTSLGFGRAEEESRTGSVDPAVIVGLEGARSFQLMSGETRLFLSAAVPVYGDTSSESDDPGATPNPGIPGKSRDRGIPGQLRLGLSWWH